MLHFKSKIYCHSTTASKSTSIALCTRMLQTTRRYTHSQALMWCKWMGYRWGGRTKRLTYSSLNGLNSTKLFSVDLIIAQNDVPPPCTSGHRHQSTSFIRWVDIVNTQNLWLVHSILGLYSIYAWTWCSNALAARTAPKTNYECTKNERVSSPFRPRSILHGNQSWSTAIISFEKIATNGIRCNKVNSIACSLLIKIADMMCWCRCYCMISRMHQRGGCTYLYTIPKAMGRVEWSSFAKNGTHRSAFLRITNKSNHIKTSKWW